MPRRAAGLTAAKVKTAKPGRYGDGAGLYLLVRSPESRFWLFRYTMAGRKREMGLGTASGPGAVTLAEVRDKADALRRTVRAGTDPLALRDAQLAEAKAAAQQQVARARTFRDVAGLYIDANEVAWRNAKHRQQWRNTLQVYAFPTMGDLPVTDVSTGHVMGVLEPIWRDKPETASRLRGRLETVLDFAKARGWRTGENPARWRGHVANMLPKRSKVAAVRHQPALPWQQVGAFMETLAQQGGTAALVLRFAILTACRSGEARGAQWGEIDLAAAVWTVPPDRMKGGRQHRVPLAAPVMALLTAQRPDHPKPGDYVFPSGRTGKPLSDMALTMLVRGLNECEPGARPRWCDGAGQAIVPHGFRSSFREWARERAGVAHEVAEAALAHTLKDKVAAAYARGDLLDRRRPLMDEWATFCGQPMPANGGNVLPFQATGVSHA